jgi:ABC-type glycerol-3-phosphate transport system substrate-binding protein
MKKLLFILGISLALAACTPKSSEDTTTTSDSTKVDTVKVDTAKVDSVK